MLTRATLLLCLLVISASALADPGTIDPAPDISWKDRWGIGLTASNFDVDSRDSEEPHLNAFSAGVVFSYRASRFL
ncbi:MAG: hypothetical protein AAGG11_24765, partial [Pseudomonadota bacterium]